MSSKHKGLGDLFHATLKQHREGRRTCAKILGKMAKAATDPALRHALQGRHEVLDGQADSLDEVFAAIDRKPHGESCEVSEAHLEVVKALIDDFEDSPALDSGLAASAAALEAHAVSRLAALRSWAGRLGLGGAAEALDRLHADSQRAASAFAGLMAETPVASPRGIAALTLKQAALLGLR